MRGFTPGPWTTGVWEGAVSGSNQHYGKHAAVFAPSGGMVCPCGLPDDPENIANARLIAAAPELYEALEKHPALPLVYDTVQLRDFNRRYCAWKQQVSAALAKARGEQV